jgi:Domain of unknown function (DUF4386)
MNKIQKIGSIAALYQAAAYIWGIVFFLFIVNYPAIVDPAQKLDFILRNQINLQVTHLLMYVVFGVSLVVLALGLHDRLKSGAPGLMQVATAIGLIWAGAVIASGMIYNIGIDTVTALHRTDPAQAALAWLTFEGVSEAIGGGKGEILGGVWTLLVSLAALQTGRLPKALNYLGLIVGGVGIVSTIPGLNDLGGVFGLGQIVWFVCLGIVMLRGKSAHEMQGRNAYMSQPKMAN